MNGNRQSPKKTLCVRDGCKAYSQSVSVYCWSHNPLNYKGGGAPAQNQNARKHGLYSHWLTEEQAATLNDATDLGTDFNRLDDDIRLLSVIVGELLRESKFVDASVVIARKAKVLQVAKTLAQGGADELATELEAILAEVNKSEQIGFKYERK